MRETIELGDLAIVVMRKDIKHAHLSVHPPSGRITLVTPFSTRPEVARAYAISKIGWIRENQAKLREQARETPRQFVSRESHFLWGRRYLLLVVERDAKPFVTIDHRRITLTVRPGSNREKREAVMHAWHRSQLHATIPSLVSKWEARLKVTVVAYFLQRMKTRWGSCNHQARHIRLNTELVKKPKDLLEYVLVHEMTHLLAPTHSQSFVRVMSAHYPAWREARLELNELPLAPQLWRA